MRIPYGIADFRKIREGDYFYIDRTDRISLIEAAGSQLLLLRPRRFGKSLWLSTLENYYDLARTDDFNWLFGALKIGQSPTPLHNRYFVLKLNFSRIEPRGDHDAIRQSLFDAINDEIQAFNLRYRDYLPQPVELHPGNALSSFRRLLAVISQTPYKLYLLIDEYDNFANEVMVSPEQGRTRYAELVQGEGTLKTFFKVIKEGAEGQGLDRVFITGVSPVVLSDITSGYNVAEDLSFRPRFQDLCGFTEAELRAALALVAVTAEQVDEALGLMRAFYNGYRFTPDQVDGVYNPTLALYFLKRLVEDATYPERLLDHNLAMDRNRIQYVAGLPHGETLITRALNVEKPLAVAQLYDRFSVEDMLTVPKDASFMASLLYYFGVLTLNGHNVWGEMRLTIPNQVVRQLYVERLRERLLPDYEDQEQRQLICRAFYTTGELAPLCRLVEQRLGILDNRDLRWANELVVKMAFLALLFNDAFYVMDSEPALGRGYADLSLIVRPDKRQHRLLDHLLEFKALPWKAMGLTGEAGQALSQEALMALPAVQTALAEAQQQLARYRQALEERYGERLRLHTHAVVCLGLERLIWA